MGRENIEVNNIQVPLCLHLFGYGRFRETFVDP